MSLTEHEFNRAHGIDEPVNPRARIGGNAPPSAIERSKDTLSELAEFIKAEPVIADENMARRAKLLIDRARGSLDDMERERDGKVRPLNTQVKEINAEYKTPASILDTALKTIVKRVNDFMDAEKAKAEEAARIKREEAERLIAEAEAAIQAKKEADENAGLGEVGIDTVAAAAEAEQKIKDANKAIRESQRAEKATNIRVGGGFGKVLTQRTKEQLILTDRIAALTAMEFPANVDEALLTAARNYRRLKGELPAGVISEKEKSL